jgi:hypothetical protein
MDRLRVLLANDLRSYREAIALALRELRPGVEVIDVEPKELDAEAKRFSPHLVICRHTTPAVRRTASSWVELYREHDASVSYVSVGGKLSKVVGGMALEELLSIIDQTQVA